MSPHSFLEWTPLIFVLQYKAEIPICDKLSLSLSFLILSYSTSLPNSETFALMHIQELTNV